MTLPAIGNIMIEPGERAVTLRLLTHHAGHPTAVFTYREISALAEALAQLRAPAAAVAALADDMELFAMLE